MSLDDASEVLGVSNGHVADLVRDGAIRGGFKVVTTVERRRVHGTMANRTIRRTVWTVSGPDVRAYKKARGR